MSVTNSEEKMQILLSESLEANLITVAANIYTVFILKVSGSSHSDVSCSQVIRWYHLGIVGNFYRHFIDQQSN